MSNEKNTSLFTILLSHTKDIFTSILSYFFLAGNEFTFKIASGLLISTAGGVMFSSKSICDNMITGDSKKLEQKKGPESPIQNLSNSNVEIKHLRSSEINENNENNENNE